MKIIFLFLFPFLITQQSWEKFTSYDGRFSVYAPGALQEKTDSVSTKLGKMAYHSFYYKNEKTDFDNHVYLVSYCDYPEGIIFADSTGLAEDFFEATMETAASSVDGEILYASDLQMDGYPGKFWRIDYLDGRAVIKTKAFLVRNRYYSIQVVSGQENAMNPSTDRFFDSFKIF